MLLTIHGQSLLPCHSHQCSLADSVWIGCISKKLYKVDNNWENSCTCSSCTFLHQFSLTSRAISMSMVMPYTGYLAHSENCSRHVRQTADMCQTRSNNKIFQDNFGTPWVVKKHILFCVESIFKDKQYKRGDIPLKISFDKSYFCFAMCLLHCPWF